MGWTSYRATEWKNGQIDRLAQCRKEFGSEPNWGTILKDCIVGSTYYAAIKLTKTQEVFGLVILTSVRDYEFSYKDMDETVGPYCFDCPNSILKLLSPTDSQYALEWRERCKKKAEQKKKLAKASLIKFIVRGDGWSHYNDGDICILNKWNWRKAKWVDETRLVGWTSSQILSQDFEVIK